MKVPNTSTFSLQNVVDVVQPISPGTPKISLLYKSSVAQDVTVSCNGYFYIMYWRGNNSLTVSEFVITHSGLYGDLLLIDEGGGYFSFVGPIGIDYGDAIITGTGNTSVVQQQPTGAGLIPTLQGCFQYANNSLFDSNYSGSKNSLYNFRNYGPNPANPGPLAENTYSITNPFASQTTKGVSIFVSNDGVNLFILGINTSDTNGHHRIIRYTMATPYNLNSAVYHSNYLINTTVSLTRRSMGFSSDGTKIFIGCGSSSLYTGGYILETYILSSAWNISSGVTRYVTNITRQGSTHIISNGFSLINNVFYAGVRTANNAAQVVYGQSFEHWYSYSNINLPYSEFPTNPNFGNNFSIRNNSTDTNMYFLMEGYTSSWAIYKNDLQSSQIHGKIVSPSFLLVKNRPSSAFSYPTDFHRTDNGYLYVLEANITGFPKVTFLIE